MSYPRAIIKIRGKPMTQNTLAPHNNPTLRPPEFDLVARDDPIGTLDRNSGLCACLNPGYPPASQSRTSAASRHGGGAGVPPAGGAGRDVGRQAAAQLLRVVWLGFPGLLSRQLACPQAKAPRATVRPQARQPNARGGIPMILTATSRTSRSINQQLKRDRKEYADIINNPPALRDYVCFDGTPNPYPSMRSLPLIGIHPRSKFEATMHFVIPFFIRCDRDPFLDAI